MRGSPLLRVALTLLALLLVALPLRDLTSHRNAVSATKSTAAVPAKAKLHLALTSTTAPFAFEILHLGQKIWKGEAQDNSVSTDLEMEVPPEGIDLVLEASWPEAKPTAIKLEVSSGDSGSSAQTLWGTQRVNDVLTFFSKRGAR